MTETKPQPPLPQRAGAIAKALATDLGALVGTVMLVHGIDLIHRPSAYIVAGLLALASALLVARRG